MLMSSFEKIHNDECAKLLKEITAHQKTHPISDSYFGLMSASNPRMIDRLRAGSGVTPRTIDRVREYIRNREGSAEQSQ